MTKSGKQVALASPLWGLVPRTLVIYVNADTKLRTGDSVANIGLHVIKILLRSDYRFLLYRSTLC